MTDPSYSAPESNNMIIKDYTSFESDVLKPLLAAMLEHPREINQNLRGPIEQLFAELEKTYPTVGSTAAQATEYSPAECAPEEDHLRSRQHDQGSALDRVSQSPVLSPAATEFRNWLTAAHPECASPRNTVGVTGEEPETPDSDEMYEPPDELLDYVTPIIPKILLSPIDSSTTPGSFKSETPEGPVPGCPTDVPYWVRHENAR